MSLDMPLQRRIRRIAEPVAERLGLEVVAVELYGGRGASVLRISLDKPGGVGIDECARFSRALSPVLDVEDPIRVAYTLEVSSPGMERPLQRARDFARFRGCSVRVRLAGMDGRRWLKGTIGGVAEPADGAQPAGQAGGEDVERAEITLVTAEGPRMFGIGEVERACLELTMEQFNRMGQGLPPVPEQEAS